MDYTFNTDVIYKNNLNIDAFSALFNNTSQCYKFYWFEALMHFISDETVDIPCDDIINEMIYEAWNTVTYYHLHLGPTINGKSENFLEHAIGIISEEFPKLKGYLSREELNEAIKECDDLIRNDRRHLMDYVPHRLLRPFFKNNNLKEGLSYIDNDSQRRLIAYMTNLTDDDKVLYYLVNSKENEIRVRVNYYWKEFLLDNYSIILSWIQYNKAQFVQARNPGVPGIIDKINMENEDKRKLEQVRTLWKTIEEITGEPIREIYTGDVINSNVLTIDHFIPRSYISNDELWNLIPMSKTLNSSKNNRLPKWEEFFLPFAEYQFYMYKKVFIDSGDYALVLKKKFDSCKRNNLNAIWALENLYTYENNRDSFISTLSSHMKPIYDSAVLQGYEYWDKQQVV